MIIGVIFFCETNKNHLPSLKLTARAPENGWLEDHPFLLGRPISGAFAVSFRECTWMSQEVRINGLFHLLINRVFLGVITNPLIRSPLILTNPVRDILSRVCHLRDLGMTPQTRLKLKRSSLLPNVSPMANVPAVWMLNVFFVKKGRQESLDSGKNH